MPSFKLNVVPLEAAEVDLDLAVPLNRFALDGRRLELPGPHGFDSFFVKTHAQGLLHARIGDLTLRIDGNPEDNAT